FLYSQVAGIQPVAESPGYAAFRVEPQPGPGLDWVRAYLVSPYGRIASRWERIGEGLLLQVEVPPNTTATILLPTGSVSAVRLNGAALTTGQGVREIAPEADRLAVTVGSGSYAFRVE
ncbi:MAG: alpha-L-rhamnosidase, partial [Bacteroidetes bacterium]